MNYEVKSQASQVVVQKAVVRVVRVRMQNKNMNESKLQYETSLSDN